MAKVIMVQGTTSNAGKSLTVAALSEYLSRMATMWLLLNHKI